MKRNVLSIHSKKVFTVLVIWFLSVAILYMPLVSCQQLVPRCNIVDVDFAGTENVSVVEEENVKTAVSGSVQLENYSRSASKAEGISVTIDKKNIRSALLSQNSRSAFYNTFKNTYRSAGSEGFEQSETSSLGVLDFELNTSSELTEADRLLYDTVKKNLADSEDLQQNVIEEQLDELIDIEGLASRIESYLSQNDRSLIIASRSAEDELTQNEIEELASAVQNAVDAQGAVLATEVLPAAQYMNESSNSIILETLNNPIEGMEDIALKYAQSCDANDNSRTLSSSVIEVSQREDLTDILTNPNNEHFKEIQTGDLFYTCGGVLGNIISGHGAVWNSEKSKFFTADMPDGGKKKSDAKTTYFSAEHQINERTGDQYMKLLHVKSSKTEEDRIAGLDDSYKRYNNRGYLIQPIKSIDCFGLYCSQVAWLTWKHMGVDIDGSLIPTSFLLILW